MSRHVSAHCVPPIFCVRCHAGRFYPRQVSASVLLGFVFAFAQADEMPSAALIDFRLRRTAWLKVRCAPPRYGEWRFDKRTYGSEPPPRNLGPPPPGMKNLLVCRLPPPLAPLWFAKG